MADDDTVEVDALADARAEAGVPNEETSPGVHGAFDTESLEGDSADDES
jgi:hypothetical protein